MYCNALNKNILIATEEKYSTFVFSFSFSSHSHCSSYFKKLFTEDTMDKIVQEIVQWGTEDEIRGHGITYFHTYFLTTTEIMPSSSEDATTMFPKQCPTISLRQWNGYTARAFMPPRYGAPSPERVIDMIRQNTELTSISTLEDSYAKFRRSYGWV